MTAESNAAPSPNGSGEDGTRVVDMPRVMRQNSKRYPLAINVTRYDGQAGYWRSVNVSEDGCFIAGEPLLRQDEELEVGLWLEGTKGADEIVTRARVAWLNTATRAKTKLLPTGMGLQFLGLAESEREALRKHLQTYGDLRKAPPLRKDAAQDRHAIGVADILEEVTDENHLPAGAVLGAYRILKALGSGGMGSVYLAEHQTLGRKVALKTLHAQFAHDPVIVRRFFDEARAVNHINHDNIIEITDFVTQGTLNFFVMEFLNGRTLTEVHHQDGNLPLSRVLNIARQLSDALAAAHEAGITHRDLKPDNVLLVEKNGDRDFVKLLDFGIAKLTQSDGVSMNQTQTGLLLGTPGYIAPEQILGGKADHRSDIYAFGVLLYQLVTGKKPFVADTWPQLLVKHTSEPPPLPRVQGAHLPSALVTLVMRCLEKDPSDRPQSMREIRDILIAINSRLRGPQAAALPVSPEMSALEEPALYPDLPPSPPKEKPLGLILGAVGGSLAVMTALIFFFVTAKHPAPAPSAELAPAPVAMTPARETMETAPVIAKSPEATVVAPAEERATKPRAAKRVAAEGTVRNAAPSNSGGVAFQLGVAQQLIQQKDFAQALQVCEALLKIAPQNALIYRHMGIAYSGLARKAAACQAFRQYLTYAPTAADRPRVEALLGGCE